MKIKQFPWSRDRFRGCSSVPGAPWSGRSDQERPVRAWERPRSVQDRPRERPGACERPRASRSTFQWLQEQVSRARQQVPRLQDRCRSDRERPARVRSVRERLRVLLEASRSSRNRFQLKYLEIRFCRFSTSTCLRKPAEYDAKTPTPNPNNAIKSMRKNCVNT